MLEEYRREYADFNARHMREYYLFLSGQKSSLELKEIYERYSDLFTQEVIEQFHQLLGDVSAHFETDRASIQHLLNFATDQYMENAAKTLTEEISRYESSATIDWQGKEITLQSAHAVIKMERNREARRELYNKRARLIEGSNDLRAERLANLHTTAHTLGYECYTALYQQLRNQDYEGLTRQLEAFLEKTEAIYVMRLDEALRRDLNLKIEDAERVDALYFLNLSGFDSHFPADQLLRVYAETMQGLGIQIENQKNVEVDSTERPRKSPRAFCAPIQIPEEVKLVIRPVGGQSDYQAMLHEGGHAQHYGWAASDLRPEFKYTGDYALTETYAFLFNHLPLDGAWLTETLNFRDHTEFVRSVMVTRLMAIRRYAAKFIYERELHSRDSLANAASRYAELQTDATKFKTGESEFLADLDDAFYSSSYLRAWAFEVALRDYLKTKFDRCWWRSKRAGDFLKEIWYIGDRYNADEMAAQIGLGKISFDLLIDEFNQQLK